MGSAFEDGAMGDSCVAAGSVLCCFLRACWCSRCGRIRHLVIQRQRGYEAAVEGLDCGLRFEATGDVLLGAPGETATE